MNTVEVKVKQGNLAGESKNECNIFRGIPYAEAPIGEYRFREPVMKKEWDGVYQALSFGNQCPQADPTEGFYGKEFYTDSKYPLPKMSEDCLYLNIWAPADMKNCPVAFWIHGGAFDHGFGSEMEFDGEKFAENGVILVTINYRVGVFGFFADEELRKENVHHTTGNYCTLDQLCALKWVKENIEAFGGNPEQITVFGQSAGAMSVQTLISSPLSKGLIQGAIMQSGGGVHNGLSRKNQMEDAYSLSKDIMKLCGVSSAEEMRKVKADKLVEILPELYKKRLGLPFSPSIDGYVNVESTDEAAKNGNVLDIPYMLGITGNDIAVQEGQDALHSQLFKGCCTFAEEREKRTENPTYLYYFNRKLPGDNAGAFHSSELWYVFGTLDRCWRTMEEKDYRLSDTMIEEWTSFVKTGNPTKGWRSYTEKEQFVRQFN